jgi:hypothetical protein
VRITYPIETPPIAQPTNCVVPTGGVLRPSAQLISITIPNCTGSIPNFWQIGRKIGVQIRIVAAMSRNVPRMNRIRLTRKKIVHGFSEIVAIALPVSSATLYRLMR